MIVAKDTRKEKTPKDKNAPKKGKSAFLFFIQERSAECKNENPDLKHKEIISKLSKIWNELSESEKKPYNLQADKDKQRYVKQKAEYETKKKDAGSTSPDEINDSTKRKTKAPQFKVEKKVKKVIFEKYVKVKETTKKPVSKKKKKSDDSESDEANLDDDDGDYSENDE
jgi:hypothetical protein